MTTKVTHGAVTLFADSAESWTDACTTEALGEYLTALDGCLDGTYARLPTVRGERSLVVCVNLDRRVFAWLLGRSGALEPDEDALVLEAVRQAPTVHVFKPIGFALHYAIGGAELTVDTVPFLPSLLNDLVRSQLTSWGQFYSLLWGS